MALSDKQKKQIRYMVSCNPTIENMERISLMNDSDVLFELEIFINSKLESLREEKTQTEHQLNNSTFLLENISNNISLLED